MRQFRLFYANAELVHCGALESPLDVEPGSNVEFAKRPVLVLMRFWIENRNSGRHHALMFATTETWYGDGKFRSGGGELWQYS